MSSDLADPYGGTLPTGGEHSFVFTLDDVAGTATVPVYTSGSRAAATSLRGAGSIDTLLDAGYQLLHNANGWWSRRL